MAAEPGAARLVKKVVVGYELSALPPWLMRSFALLRSKLARAGFKVDVVLRPLGQLPPDTDVLFVSARLLAAGLAAAPQGALVLPLQDSITQQSAFHELLQKLQLGQELCARRIADEPDNKIGSRGGTIVRYRGNEPID